MAEEGVELGGVAERGVADRLALRVSLVRWGVSLGVLGLLAATATAVIG